MNSIFINIISILWIFFILFWFISAFRAKKTIYSGRWWIGAPIRLFLFVLIVWFVDLPASHRFRVYEMPVISNPVAGVIGLILTALGIAFAIWARVYLGRNWGMPMSLKENRELVTAGPYRFVRHPIYTGILLAMLGTALVIGFIWLIVFAVSCIYFIYAAITEEKIMSKEFPDEYPAYMRRTKMLVPFIF